MKCEQCNLECENNINYCPKFGKMRNNNSSITLSKTKDTKCIKCNFEQLDSNTYCSKCGNLLYNASKFYGSKKVKKIGVKNREYFKEKIIISISAMLLLSIVSVFIKFFIGILDKEMISNMSTINIILGLNLAPIEVIVTKVMEFNKMDLNTGLMVYLLVPSICISIAINIFKVKREYVDNRNIMKDSIIIGLIYGILLGVVSIFSSNVFNDNIDLFYQTTIIVKYKFMGTVTNGTIIASIIAYINLAIRNKSNQVKLGIEAIKTILVIYLTIILILIISIYLGNSLGYSKNLLSIIGIIQIAIYFLLISSCVPILILGDIISIMNISNIATYLNESVIIFIYGSVLISFMVILIGGYLIKYKFKTNNVIKIYSIYYAIFIGGLTHISELNSFSGLNILNISNYNQHISIEGNILVSIIVAYIYSYIVANMGYKLNKEYYTR